MRLPPDDPHPFFFGSDDVVEGYYELERIERNVGMDCICNHPTEARLWYYALTLYHRAMNKTWDFADSGRSAETINSLAVQVHLLGVNLGLAKSCFDNLLAGYYSAAYAIIRHMIETSMHNVYFALCPEEASDYWRKADTIRTQVRKKSKKIDPKLGHIVEQLYSQWKVVSIGAHPSVEGLRSSESDIDHFRVFGANYIEVMFQFGIEQGLYAISSLLNWFRVVGTPSNDWIALLDTWMDDIDKWRTETIAPNVNEEGEWISDD